MKQLISLILTIAVLLCICPRDDQIKAADVQTQTDLESVIREQIEAFAKSIDQKNADDTAAKALASHGISGRGKKLSVGKNHALTATLMNAELMLDVLSKGCAQAIRQMDRLGRDSLLVHATSGWYSGAFTSGLYYFKNQSDADNFVNLVHHQNLKNSTGNTYDETLVWIGGSVLVEATVKRTKVTSDTVVYSVKVVSSDQFDFRGTDGSIRDDLASILGSIFFRAFDWVATATFEFTVPNECEHSYKTQTTKPTCTTKGYTTYTCSLCGCSYKADYTAKLSHKYDGETDGDCNLCGEVRFLRGDMNGDSAKNSADAIYLLRHSIMPEMYPLSQAADVNGDGTVNSADAVYLLRHTIMPQAYPLK